jgi:hypothetical protein
MFLHGVLVMRIRCCQSFLGSILFSSMLGAHSWLEWDSASSSKDLPLLYSGLAELGGNFFQTETKGKNEIQEIRGEGMLAVGLPRFQGERLYAEWEYAYLYHGGAFPRLTGVEFASLQEHRLSGGFQFALPARFQVGALGFFTWLLWGLPPKSEVKQEILRSMTLIPWFAYLWKDTVQSGVIGRIEKSSEIDDPWYSFQTWDKDNRKVSWGLWHEMSWEWFYTVLQWDSVYYRNNDFWQDRREYQLGVYGEIHGGSDWIFPLSIRQAQQNYIWPRIRMARVDWQRAHPEHVVLKGDRYDGNVGIRWRVWKNFWFQTDVQYSYDTMETTEVWLLQASLAWVTGRAKEKRDRFDRLFHPFTSYFIF